MSEDKLTISKIRDGTVIDHIAAGKGLIIPHILGMNVDSEDIFTVLVNAQSSHMGKKDIVKIQNRELKEKELNLVALIASDATINIIKNFKVTDKRKVVLPKHIEGLLKCLNSSCITNNDPEATTSFDVVSRAPLVLQCSYCSIDMNELEILNQLSGK